MKQAAEALLREMVSIYSPAGQEWEITQYLVRAMQERGLQAHLDEAGNVIGELGNGSRSVVLLGHIDTVPGFIPVRQEAGRLYGRGAVDAKGPFATFVSAAAQYGTPRDAKLIIIGAVEEEGDSAGARYIVDRCRPDFAIIGEPSGWNHITLGYKGSMTLCYTLERETSHSAGAAQTAAETAVAFWTRLQGYAESFNQGKTRLFDRLMPTLASITSRGDGFTEGVEMVIQLRWPAELDVPAFESWLRDEAAPATATITSREVPYRAEKRTLLTGAFLAAIRAAGGEPGFTLKTGTSDMNVVGPAWGCPIVAYGPGDSSLDHTPNEHIEWAEYHRAIEVLGLVIRRL